jgi:hypothetical protein
MFEFAPDDFAPLDEFPLLWRWTRPTHDVLPSEVLATIRPLRPATARALAPAASAQCLERGRSAAALTFAADADAPRSARRQLDALGIGAADAIVVSWDAETAVATAWATFVAHWDAFCYPSSDDVTVWAPGGGWTLCYRHFQVMEFARVGGAT